MIYYKIQNKEGLFSQGGIHPYFNKRGKIWFELRHAKAHLAQFYTKHWSKDDTVTLSYTYYENYIENCILLKYNDDDIIEIIPLLDFFKDKQAEVEKRYAERKIARDETRAKARAKIEALQK